MNRTELHPIEALLVAVIVVFDAVRVLAVSLLALLLTVADEKPTSRRRQSTQHLHHVRHPQSWPTPWSRPCRPGPWPSSAASPDQLACPVH
jgi:hypothetical protein